MVWPRLAARPPRWRSGSPRPVPWPCDGARARGGGQRRNRSDSADRQAKWPLRPGSRWRALSDVGCAGQQLQQLAGDVAEGVARDWPAACEYRGGADCLGANRAARGRARFLLPGYLARASAGAARAPGIIVVRDMEEQWTELCARMGEAPQRALSTCH